MILSEEIDYTSADEVSKIVLEIESAIKENGITKGKICEIVGMNIATYSNFRKGHKNYVNEKRIRAIVKAVNLYHR